MKKEMIIVLLYVLSFLATGTCVALTAIRTAQKTSVIKLPPIIHQPPLPAPAISPTTTGLDAIRQFLHWMDSLQSTPSGRSIYDSIRRTRPGLLDSARQAEKYYTLLKNFK
ncbi:MAG: hypothetical protein JST68_29320 [Bacteroidetes bacterium]|nr:hypothetical protein [Bacteroidota bacterium]